MPDSASKFHNEEIVDHAARSTAMRALDAISSHEMHCGERWSEARRAADSTTETLKEGFKKSDGEVSRLHARVDRIIWAVAAGAVALVGNTASMWLKVV